MEGKDNFFAFCDYFTTAELKPVCCYLILILVFLFELELTILLRINRTLFMV